MAYFKRAEFWHRTGCRRVTLRRPFADVLSGTGVSKSVVSRVTRCLSEDLEAFRKRVLSNEKLLYLELDGTYLRYHQGAERKEPILVATGYRADGTRVLLHMVLVPADRRLIKFRARG